MFLELQISILDCFLKDHVTLKIGVMAAVQSALLFTELNYTLKYFQIETLILNCKHLLRLIKYFFNIYKKIVLLCF